MKKTILGLAFLTIFGTSFSAFAQQDKTKCNNTECVKGECKGQKCDKPGKCDKVKKGDKKQMGAQRRQVDLFEGITLTDAQKAKIQDLNNAAKVSRQENAKLAKEAKESKADFKKIGKENREKYLKDMSQILTSDQYVQYLQNYYINSPRQHKPMAHKGMKGQKGQKGFKGPKGANGPKAPQAK